MPGYTIYKNYKPYKTFSKLNDARRVANLLSRRTSEKIHVARINKGGHVKIFQRGKPQRRSNPYNLGLPKLKF